MPTLAAETRATIALAWPLIATNLAQMALAATDVVLMGRLGPPALAAGALGVNLYFAHMIFGIGLVTATAPMVAREVGRMRHSVRDVRRTVRQGLWSAAILAVPAWLILWQAEPILRLLGQDPALAAGAALYVHTLQWGLLPFLGFLVLRSFMAALGRPRPALWVMLGGIVLNAFLAIGLMFGRFGFPRLELVGAGIATSLSSLAMFAALATVAVFDRRLRRYRVFGHVWRPDWARFRQFWHLGLPIATTLWLEVSIFNAAAFMMGMIGAASLAAHQIAIQIASLTFMVPLGLSQAATIRVGRAFGAGDPRGVSLAGWSAFALTEGFMVLTAAAFLLAPKLLIAAFLDLGDPANAAAIGLAATFLAYAAIFQLVDGAQAVGAGMLRGLHDTKVPLFFALAGYWGIGLPLGAALAFRFGLGGAGIWAGLATGLAVVSVLMMGRWLRRERLGLVRA